jgi:hypothetical protein
MMIGSVETMSAGSAQFPNRHSGNHQCRNAAIRQSNGAIPNHRIINKSSIVIPQSSMDAEHAEADNAACSR